MTTATDPNPPVRHPGPASAVRAHVAATGIRPFDIVLAPGDAIEQTILAAFARAGCASGWVRMDGLACDPIRFVLPAPSPNPDRLAWYSDPVAPTGPARIHAGHMSVGRHGADGSTHCHGLFHLADGTRTLGHLLAADSRAAAPATLAATGFADARLTRRPDPETRFDLLTAEGGLPQLPTPGAVVLTLRPNANLADACRAACRAYGLRAARIVGLGSLNGAAFLDGRHMASPINEFLLRRGRIHTDGTALLDIAAIDVHGRAFSGPVDPARTTVSITAELVLLPDAPPGPAP